MCHRVVHCVAFELAINSSSDKKCPQPHVYSSPVTFAGLLVGHEVEVNYLLTNIIWHEHGLNTVPFAVSLHYTHEKSVTLLYDDDYV